MPDFVYSLMLGITRWLLPLLSLAMVLLWIRGYRSFQPPKKTLARFVTREGEPTAITVAEAMIGCKPHCDMTVDDPSVAKRHALLYQREEAWLLSPLQGEVYLNEKPLKKTAPVLDGDLVAFGEREFVFQCNGLESDEVSSHSPTGGGWLTLCLTLFQLLLGGQLCLRFAATLSPYLPLCFGLLIALSCSCFLIKKALGKGKMLWEAPVLYLATLGVAVCACSAPESLPKQLLCGAVGIGGSFLFAFLLKHPKWCFALRFPVAGLCLGVLWFTVLFGTRIFGSVNWLSIGGISFQPSEFAKIAFVTVGACTLPVVAKKPMNRWFFMVFAGLTMGALVCMVDFGAIAIFFVTMIVLLCMRLTDWKLVTGICLCAVGAGATVLTVFPHVATRFSAWLHVWELASTSGYQQTRTLIAAASGGLLGVGGGNGTLLSVSAADTDLVFGVLCEEYGQIVGLCAALCFVALTLVALRLAKTTKSAFSAMGVCAVSAMMLFQTALNLFGSTDILPLTGVTMMFVSRGGTSLTAAFLLTAFFTAAEVTPSPLETERRRYY